MGMFITHTHKRLHSSLVQDPAVCQSTETGDGRQDPQRLHPHCELLFTKWKTDNTFALRTLFVMISFTFRSSPVTTARFMTTRDRIGHWCLSQRKRLQTFLKRFVFYGVFVTWCCVRRFLRSNVIVSGLSCQSEQWRSARLCPDPGSSSGWGPGCGEWRLIRSGLQWLAAAKPHHRTGEDALEMTVFMCTHGP